MMDGALAGQQFCYLTTTGRVSGLPRRIEIWFALEGRTLYMLSGGGERSDWVRNVRAAPAVTVEIGGRVLAGKGRLVDDEREDALARRVVHDKYAPGYAGSLGRWRDTALPVAVDLLELPAG
jgi:deazaflavin-dependent oxidoreductase (nitroreductase family)